MGGKRRASTAEPSDVSDVEVSRKPAKKSKKSKKSATAQPPANKDDDGNPFWELSNKRRVGLSQFKNVCFVNIREYYEKDGKVLPGKKGISLTLEQYSALLKAVPAINDSLREMGQVVDAGGGVEDSTPAIVKKEKKVKSSKSNIEATSDEED